MEHITTTLLQNLKSYLEKKPIALDTASLIDFLFQHYPELVPVSTQITRDKYRAVAFAVLDLIKERDAARGVETEITWDEKGGVPYNEELEKVLSLVNELETAYGDDAFRTGFVAGTRMTMEIYGERVGITAE